MGLFTEGYVLFSIGNLKTLYQVAYPSCWKTFTSCSETLTQTTDYFQIVGIVIGQVGVGFLGDWIGRRYGLIQDAMIMFLGVFMLTVSDGPDYKGWVIMYAISQVHLSYFHFRLPFPRYSFAKNEYHQDSFETIHVVLALGGAYARTELDRS